MVSYKELEEAASTEKLNKGEQDALDKLEAKIDEILRNGFANNYSIVVEDKHILDAIKPFGVRRRLILIDNILNKYRKYGWDVEYNSEYAKYDFKGK